MPKSGNKHYLLRVDPRGQAFNHVSVSTPTLPRARIPSEVKVLFLLSNFSSDMPDIIDMESTLSQRGKEVMEEEFALDIHGLSKTYTKTMSGSDAKTNWKKMLGILTAKRKNQAKESLEEFHALRDVSFNLRQGESLGIIGLNGSGKSTLLQIIAGTLEPTTGKVKTKGRIAALLELGSGFNPDFTGKENIYLNATILGLSQSEIDAKYDEIVSFADIGDFIHQPVRTYSSGMGLRLAFAVMVNVNPDILIIDEALAVGDAVFIQKCMRFLRDFKTRGNLILVTHDIAAVQSLCERCIWLSEGKLQSDGPPKKVTDLYLEHIFGKTGTQQKLSEKQLGSPDSTSWDEKQEEQRKHDYARNAFSFNPNAASLGDGGAVVEQVEFTERKSDQQINSVSGGEEVSLIIQVRVARSIIHPVIGFIFRNRLGQDLFSENTYSAQSNTTEPVTKGDALTATFWFCMPILPSGEYSLTVAVAEATDKDFELHHWIHDAIFIKSISRSWSTGLVGIPMNKVELKKQ